MGPGDGHQRILLILLVLGAALVIGRFFVPPVLLALRRLAGLTRRLAGEWCGVPIAESYQPPPADLAELHYTARLRWLLSDAATWRDLLWVVVNALVGWILAVASAALIVVGGVVFLVPVLFARGPAARLPREHQAGPGHPRLRDAGHGGGGGAVAAARVRPAGRYASSRRPARPSWPCGSATCRRPGPRPWTPGRPRSAGSSATCTTARRPGWWPWA